MVCRFAFFQDSIINSEFHIQDPVFGAIELPSWAGQPHEVTSLTAVPKKANGKAKAKPKAKAAASSQGAADSSGVNRKRGGSGDSELEKIMIQRKALFSSRRWKSAVLELSTVISSSISRAEGVEGTEEFHGSAMR